MPRLGRQSGGCFFPSEPRARTGVEPSPGRPSRRSPEMLDELRDKIWARTAANCKICWTCCSINTALRSAHEHKAAHLPAARVNEAGVAMHDFDIDFDAT
jgi:hypothetical protein